MPRESNLVKARSTIVWLLALLCAYGAVWWIERESGRTLIAREASQAPAAAAAAAPAPPALAASPDLPPAPAPRPLSEQERAWARTAWAYFEQQTDPGTGLAGSVAGYGGFTAWDAGSSLLALLAAHDLGLVTPAAFDDRLARALGALERLPLFEDRLPNKAYDVRTLAATDYANQPAPQGIGWSALDVARLLVPLEAVVWQHPHHTPAVQRVLARWALPALAAGGELAGTHRVAGGVVQPAQEGRHGYAQYGAAVLLRHGLDVLTAADWRHQLALVEVQGVPLCADRRDPARFGAHDVVASDPYLLLGLELGWSRDARECAWRLLRAQQARFQATGVPTALTEDHVDRPPYFVYAGAWGHGRPWAAVTEAGEDVAALRTLSTKAAFGWHALVRNGYTEALLREVAPLHAAGGWYAGRYEADGAINKVLAANTNAVVLESLAYIARGPLLAHRSPR